MMPPGPLSHSAKSSSLPSGPFRSHDPRCDHAVVFYLEENFLLRVLADFFTNSLQAGGTAIMLATAARRDALASRLHRDKIDLPALKRDGHYLEFDCDQVLSACMANQTLDHGKLEQMIDGAVEAASHNLRGPEAQVTIFGELVTRLWAKRDFAALSGFERFGHSLSRRASSSILCAYPIKEFVETGTEESFLQICAMHSTVIPPEDFPTADAERRIMHATARNYAEASKKRSKHNVLNEVQT